MRKNFRYTDSNSVNIKFGKKYPLANWFQNLKIFIYFYLLRLQKYCDLISTRFGRMYFSIYRINMYNKRNG